jgi:hypothetical protein
MKPVSRELSTSARTVLIVGEDVALVADLRRGVQDSGHRPVSASDKRDAVEAITHEKPVLIIAVTTCPGDATSRFLATVGRVPALARIPLVLLAMGGVSSGASIGGLPEEPPDKGQLLTSKMPARGSCSYRDAPPTRQKAPPPAGGRDRGLQ